MISVCARNMQTEDKLTQTEKFKQCILNSIRRSFPDKTSRQSVDRNQFFHCHHAICTTFVTNTGRFIMFSVITNIYNKKTKGPTLMEFFTATGKLKKFFLTTGEFRCVHHG